MRISRLRAVRPLREGMLAERISWLEPAHAANLDTAASLPLDPVMRDLPDLPRPPELSAWAQEHNQGLRVIHDQSTAFQRDLDRRSGVLGLPSIRTSLAGRDQTAAISLSLENPALGLSYGAQIAESGTEPGSSGGGSSTDEWQAGISLTIPVNLGAGEAVARDVTSARRPASPSVTPSSPPSFRTARGRPLAVTIPP